MALSACDLLRGCDGSEPIGPQAIFWREAIKKRVYVNTITFNYQVLDQSEYSF
jgi:hypothetical protein